MKIGFSSLAAPDWDLEKLIGQAKALGFEGLELRGLLGQLHLPLVPSLARDPTQSAELFGQAGVELVCLGTSSSLGDTDAGKLAKHRTELLETIELAAALHCPLVRIFAGEIPRNTSGEATLSRIAAELISLAEIAARHRVTIVVENGGDFLSSRDLWFVADAVSHPAVQVCWSPCHAMLIKERSTNAIPRLSGKLALVHVCDADFDERGRLVKYQLPGQGQVDWVRTIEILRGVVYRGYLMFEWPKLWVASLPAPESVLGEVARFLRGRIEHRDPVLTAYKGDKQKPNYPSLSGKPPEVQPAKH